MKVNTPEGRPMSDADYFRLFGDDALRSFSPLYNILAHTAAGDPEILALAARHKPGQPPPNLLLAAVHRELLRGAGHALKDYYPSCGGKRAASDGDPYALFRDFALARKEVIVETVATRVTNTNEVGRSTSLYPAYDWLARKTGKPLQILEVGPSAGLNLNWFRYGYRYTDEAGKVVLERETGRELVLPGILKGANRPPLAADMPRVALARGLELNPINIADPEERLWQRALIFPERLDRLARLDPALAIATRHPPAIVAGDAAKDLARVLERYDRSLPVAIVHTSVTYQFPPDVRLAFQAALTQAARDFELYEIANEWQIDHHRLEVVEHSSTPVARRILGRSDAHGTWLEWL